jgi:ribosomal-protein-alanine N-acetyltransferase
VAAPGWPAVLADDRVGVRPIRFRDAMAWSEVRARNLDWLAPWEATAPGGPGLAEASAVSAFPAMVRNLRRHARAGGALPFVVIVDDALVGQVTVAGILRGALNGGHVGYWVDRQVAGRGVIPTALALVADHCFTVAGLHRLEANVRPENAASRRVVEKLGFRDEGLRRRFLYIDGDYRDHVSYALMADDVPEGVLRRWHSVRESAR